MTHMGNNRHVKSPNRNNPTIAFPKFRGNRKSGGIRSKRDEPTFYPQLLPPLFYMTVLTIYGRIFPFKRLE